MSSLNINSLFDEADKKHLNRLKLFDDILVRIHNRIIYHSNNKWFYCSFNIPEFIIGKPLYNVEDLRKYLIDSLKRDKFDVMYVHPNFLFSHDMNKKLGCIYNTSKLSLLRESIKYFFKSSILYKGLPIINSGILNVQ